MKTFFILLIATIITSCTEKTQNIVDAGSELTVLKLESLDSKNYTITYKFPSECQDMPENLDEVLQKLVEEARQNSICRDN